MPGRQDHGHYTCPPVHCAGQGMGALRSLCTPRLLPREPEDRPRVGDLPRSRSVQQASKYASQYQPLMAARLLIPAMATKHWWRARVAFCARDCPLLRLPIAAYRGPQEQLAEGSNFLSTDATGRPAQWPRRSPDAPPDPATRT
jgi:hypothetical protein